MDNVSKEINTTLDKISTILKVVEDELSGWDGIGNKNVNEFMNVIAGKMSWDIKQLKAHDPIIRFHLKNHEIYSIDRGALGGIVKKGNKKVKTVAAKKRTISQDKIKEELKSQIEAELLKKYKDKEVVIEEKVIAENEEASNEVFTGLDEILTDDDASIYEESDDDNQDSGEEVQAIGV